MPVAVTEKVTDSLTNRVALDGWVVMEGAVQAGLTVWVIAGLVLVRKLPSPPYTAVIEWLPTLSEDVEKVATPPEREPVPRVVVPSLKVTVPVAVLGVTVAVKVTESPKFDGFWEEATVVEVVALFTVKVPSLVAVPALPEA